MSLAESKRISDIINELRTWPNAERLRLALLILEPIENKITNAPTYGESLTANLDLHVTDASLEMLKPFRGVPVESVVGLLRTDRDPPTDEECRQIVEEERWKRYGH